MDGRGTGTYGDTRWFTIGFAAEKPVVNGIPQTPQLHVVVILPDFEFNSWLISLEGDPDWVSASPDLGWGGIDTVKPVRIFNQLDRSWHTMDIHIEVFNHGYEGKEPYWMTPDNFWVRAGEYVTGYVLLDGEMWHDFDAPIPAGHKEKGWVFSTREPF